MHDLASWTTSYSNTSICLVELLQHIKEVFKVRETTCDLSRFMQSARLCDFAGVVQGCTLRGTARVTRTQMPL